MYFKKTFSWQKKYQTEKRFPGKRASEGIKAGLPGVWKEWYGQGNPRAQKEACGAKAGCWSLSCLNLGNPEFLACGQTQLTRWFWPSDFAFLQWWQPAGFSVAVCCGIVVLIMSEFSTTGPKEILFRPAQLFSRRHMLHASRQPTERNF